MARLGATGVQRPSRAAGSCGAFGGGSRDALCLEVRPVGGCLAVSSPCPAGGGRPPPTDALGALLSRMGELNAAVERHLAAVSELERRIEGHARVAARLAAALSAVRDGFPAPRRWPGDPPGGWLPSEAAPMPPGIALAHPLCSRGGHPAVATQALLRHIRKCEERMDAILALFGRNGGPLFDGRLRKLRAQAALARMDVAEARNPSSRRAAETAVSLLQGDTEAFERDARLGMI